MKALANGSGSRPRQTSVHGGLLKIILGASSKKHHPTVIESIEFRDFRVLERATLPLGIFNLLLGPNGSGKTTAIRALLALGSTAQALERAVAVPLMRDLAGASAVFRLGRSLAGACVELRIDADGVPALSTGKSTDAVGAVLAWLSRFRGYVLDPVVLARPVEEAAKPSLGWDGEGLGGVLAATYAEAGGRWDALVGEFRRLMPEFSDVIAGRSTRGGVSFSVVTKAGKSLSPENLSQGALVLLGVLAIVFGKERPSLLCLEELERGLHPRLLREMRDLLYRMSFPDESGLPGPAVQVIATTHSPYILDLFADTPEDVILATKEADAATFRRLDTIPELAEMLQSGRLGDLWYSGILGGVP
ncbi:MAG TPA: AAA family ATPase [Opitutaceae bacterium]